MVRVVHYVGMTEDTYQRARRVFGGPAYFHRRMDDRVMSEVGSEDVVIFEDASRCPYVWDASAVPRRYTE